MYLDIIRWTDDEHGTFGIIRYNDRLICHSLELPDIDNKPFISRIPNGSYHAEIIFFKNKYPAIYIKDVPGRSGIVIHIANRTEEIQGCIAPGTYIKFEKTGEKVVYESSNALKKIVKTVQDDKHLIVRVIEI